MSATTLTNLIKDTGSSLNAASIYNALVKAGIAEEREYLSTTGSGEIKSYLALTAEGLAYGINKPTAHEFKTDARFYPEKFAALITIVAAQITEEARALSRRG